MPSRKHLREKSADEIVAIAKQSDHPDYAAALYIQGRQALVDKDYQTAFALLTSSSKNGYADATAALGYMYEFGLGVNKDATAALKLYEKSLRTKPLSPYGYLGKAYIIRNDDPALFRELLEKSKAAYLAENDMTEDHVKIVRYIDKQLAA